VAYYEAHQIVWQAFPNQRERPFLYHFQEHADYFGLLVQSTLPPDWSHLSEVDIRVKVFDPRRVEVGDQYDFSLRANPTVQREGYADGKRRRVAVSANPDLRRRRAANRGLDVSVETFDREGTLLKWLARKGEQSGFALVGAFDDTQDTKCHAGPTISYRFHRSRAGHRSSSRFQPMTIHGCEFTGRLKVTDAETFATARCRGIGRARAFGFGLLMVRPSRYKEL
jgi:CRISPR system Cascade subunit CasE